MGTQTISFLSIGVKARSACTPTASKQLKRFKEKQVLGEIGAAFNIKSFSGA